MSYKPRKVLITGGVGFIGSHFITFLLKKYQDLMIVNVDKLTYASDVGRLSAIANDSRYHFIQNDIGDAAVISDTLKEFRVDTIVNFAAETHVDRSITNPKLFFETNVMGTQTLLHCALDFWGGNYNLDPKYCRFHQISTDEVYGALGPADKPFTEHSLYCPNSPYAASKAASDHLVCAYHRTYGLPVTLSRCSNNFGLYQHREKLIPKVIISCLEKQPIPVYGDGSNIRDWIDVIDHCRAIDIILQSGVVGQSYNIGGNCEVSNIEIVKAICAQMDHFFPKHVPHAQLITFVEDRLGHDRRYAIDYSFLEKTLGWKPENNIFRSLKNLISAVMNFYPLNPG